MTPRPPSPSNSTGLRRSCDRDGLITQQSPWRMHSTGVC